MAIKNAKKRSASSISKASLYLLKPKEVSQRILKKTTCKTKNVHRDTSPEEDTTKTKAAEKLVVTRIAKSAVKASQRTAVHDNPTDNGVAAHLAQREAKAIPNTAKEKIAPAPGDVDTVDTKVKVEQGETFHLMQDEMAELRAQVATLEEKIKLRDQVHECQCQGKEKATGEQDQVELEENVRELNAAVSHLYNYNRQTKKQFLFKKKRNSTSIMKEWTRTEDL